MMRSVYGVRSHDNLTISFSPFEWTGLDGVGNKKGTEGKGDLPPGLCQGCRKMTATVSCLRQPLAHLLIARSRSSVGQASERCKTDKVETQQSRSISSYTSHVQDSVLSIPVGRF